LASLAENDLSLINHSGRNGEVISINEATIPIFSAFCVLCGNFSALNPD